MKKNDRIKSKIEKRNDLVKALTKTGPYRVDDFIRDAKTYIAAVKDGRILYDVRSVSRSGMSRTISITSCERYRYDGKVGYSYRQYAMMLEVLGYKRVDSSRFDAIRVHGCGMNMVFYTNYCIMRTLRDLGFISKQECRTLAQKVN